MLTLILLAVAFGWMGWDWYQEWMADRRAAERLAERAALRRQMTARFPDSPAANEALGDALRESGDLEEAIAAYEKAQALSREAADSSGASIIASGGLENKLRLTRMELAEKGDPRTLRSRESTCRICGALAMPVERNCRECGAPLPVNGFLETLRPDAFRADIAGAAAQALVMIVLVAVALLIASWMPLAIRLLLAVAALFIIPFRLLKKLGDG